MLDITPGNILDCKEKYLIHQTNCITKKSAGLAKEIFTRFPYANFYESRTEEDSKPGHFVIRGDGQSQRLIVGINGQVYPGKPKYPESNLDGSVARAKHFYHGLLRLSKVPDLESVAFPFKIGCSLAGGEWDHYHQMISNFAEYVAKQGVKTVIYKHGE
jgi:O-acetyl-ADP-ribose deacetylase (regulator of RNase III)